MVVVDALQKHNAYQRQAFDDSVACFLEPIPENVKQRMRRIVAAACVRPTDRVLDVGTGAGALIPFIRRQGAHHVLGCDLSPAMLAEARRRHPNVPFWQGDVLHLPRAFGVFDVVFFNAMFANLWDQAKVLRAISGRLAVGGRIVISHPMGAGFVRELKAGHDRLIPHGLPDASELASLIRYLPLRKRRFQDEPQLYLCVLIHRL